MVQILHILAARFLDVAYFGHTPPDHVTSVSQDPCWIILSEFSISEFSISQYDIELSCSSQGLDCVTSDAAKWSTRTFCCQLMPLLCMANGVVG